MGHVCIMPLTFIPKVALDTWWQESAGETRGDVETISGAGDENTRMELGPNHEVDSGKKTLTFFRHAQGVESDFICTKTDLVFLPNLVLQ